jgi:hypothetical protein
LVGIPIEPGSPQIVALMFSFVVTAVFIFVLQISRIVGGRTLRDWVLGRYHRPREEERFFLFVDLAGSTALAERIGPVAVHKCEVPFMPGLWRQYGGHHHQGPRRVLHGLQFTAGKSGSLRAPNLHPERLTPKSAHRCGNRV